MLCLCKRVFLLVWNKIQEFSEVTGLFTNLDKSNILLKGQWDPVHRVQLPSTGLKIVEKYKYLGIGLGAKTAEEAYGPALRKATGRAFSMQSWSLSLVDRVELLQSWILPVLVYPARVVYPSDNVIAAVRTIYQVALKLSNWGITLDILSHSKGGRRTYALMLDSMSLIHCANWGFSRARFTSGTLSGGRRGPSFTATRASCSLRS